MTRLSALLDELRATAARHDAAQRIVVSGSYLRDPAGTKSLDVFLDLRGERGVDHTPLMVDLLKLARENHGELELLVHMGRRFYVPDAESRRLTPAKNVRALRVAAQRGVRLSDLGDRLHRHSGDSAFD